MQSITNRSSLLFKLHVCIIRDKNAKCSYTNLQLSWRKSTQQKLENLAVISTRISVPFSEPFSPLQTDASLTRFN